MSKTIITGTENMAGFTRTGEAPLQQIYATRANVPASGGFVPGHAEDKPDMDSSSMRGFTSQYSPKNNSL